MRVSQNYCRRWVDRNCTSNPLKIRVKIFVFKGILASIHLIDKALLDGSEFKK